MLLLLLLLQLHLLLLELGSLAGLEVGREQGGVAGADRVLLLAAVLGRALERVVRANVQSAIVASKELVGKVFVAGVHGRGLEAREGHLIEREVDDCVFKH